MWVFAQESRDKWSFSYEMETNVKNIYDILAVINIPCETVKPTEYVVLQQCTNCYLFLQFLRVLVEERALVGDDTFIVNNYTIHIFGDNMGIDDSFSKFYGALMITVPLALLRV